MNNKITLSIGIPAFNEGGNIRKVLLALVGQREAGFRIREILVVSDGSSDNTAEEVRKVNDKRIRLFADGSRLGKTTRLNQIFREFKGDVLVLMDADIVITDPLLLSKLVTGTDISQAGIVAVNASPLPARTFFEKVLESSVLITKNTARSWNKGNNYLSFKGCFLALDKKLAKSITMLPTVVNNDAYLYFAAVQIGYTPAYKDNAVVYYKSPSTLEDHIKQSSRFQQSQKELQQYFQLDLSKQYAIPRSLIAQSILKYLLIKPLYVSAYLAVNLISKYKKQKQISSIWQMAVSTKGGA